MAGFSIPGSETALPPLPAEIQGRIERDVRQFAAKFEPYKLFVSADKIAGWVLEYRGALVAFAYLCLASGEARAGTVDAVGGPR
jgi:hypothetical protein